MHICQKIAKVFLLFQALAQTSSFPSNPQIRINLSLLHTLHLVCASAEALPQADLCSWSCLCLSPTPGEGACLPHLCTAGPSTCPKGVSPLAICADPNVSTSSEGRMIPHSLVMIIAGLRRSWTTGRHSLAASFLL